MTGGALLRQHLFRRRLPRPVAREHHPRAEQVVEEQVAGRRPGRVAAQDEDAAQPAARGRRRRLTGVVRLDRAQRHERVRPCVQRLADGEFQLAGLVAAGGEAGLVIALHEEPGPAERPGEAGQLLDGRRKVAQADARQGGGEHGGAPRWAGRRIQGGRGQSLHLPAHGASLGRLASRSSFAEAVSAVAARVGARAAIGHSMGAAGLGWARPRSSASSATRSSCRTPCAMRCGGGPGAATAWQRRISICSAASRARRCRSSSSTTGTIARCLGGMARRMRGWSTSP